MSEEIDWSRVDTRLVSMDGRLYACQQNIAKVWLGRDLLGIDDAGYEAVARIYREQGQQIIKYASDPESNAAREFRTALLSGGEAHVPVAAALSDPALGHEMAQLPDQVLNRLATSLTADISKWHQHLKNYPGTQGERQRHDEAEATRRLLAREIVQRSPERAAEMAERDVPFVSKETFALFAGSPDSTLWISADRSHAAEIARAEDAARHAARPPASGAEPPIQEGRASFGASRALSMFAAFAPDDVRERFALALDKAQFGVVTRAVETAPQGGLRTSFWTVDAGFEAFLNRKPVALHELHDLPLEGIVMTRWSFQSPNGSDHGAATFRGQEAVQEFHRAAAGFDGNGRPARKIASVHILGKGTDQSLAWHLQHSVLDVRSATFSSHDLNSIARTRFTDPDPRVSAVVGWAQTRFPRASATTLSEVARIAKGGTNTSMGAFGASGDILQLPEIAQRANVAMTFSDPHGSGDWAPSLKSDLNRKDLSDLRTALATPHETARPAPSFSAPGQEDTASPGGTSSAEASSRALAQGGPSRSARIQMFGNLVSLKDAERGIEAVIRFKEGPRTVQAHGGAATALKGFSAGDRLKLSVETTDAGQMKAVFVSKAEPFVARDRSSGKSRD